MGIESPDSYQVWSAQEIPPYMEPYERITRFLREVRRALNRVSLGEAALAALAILGVATVAALALAAALGLGPGRWGWAAIGLGLVGAGIALWRLWLRPRGRRAADDELALWVEERIDGLQSGLVTAVQTRAMVAAPDARPLGFSATLAREAAAQTSRGIAEVIPRTLPERRRLKRLLGVAAGVGACMGLLAVATPELYTEGGALLVAAPEEEALADGVRLVPVAMSQLNLEIVPPEYTGIKPRKLDRSAGDFEALAGSEVRFAGTALYDAKEAYLALESDPEGRWALDLSADGAVKGAFRVGASDRYQFVLVDKQGATIHEKAWRSVDSRSDAAPEVELLLPESDLEVKPDDQLSFFFEASDDYGLDRVELVIEDETGHELDRHVVRSPRGERLSRGDEGVAVARLELEPGDSAELHFEAFDLNSLSGPGIGKSASRRITLYSPEAEHDRLLEDLDRLIDRMIDVLADRLESPIEAKETLRLANYVATGQGINAATLRLVADMTTLVNGFSTDALVSDELRTALREVRERQQEIADQEGAHLRRSVLGTANVEDDVMVMLLFEANNEGASELESGVLRLHKLLDESRKDSVLDAGRELLETQNEIMDLLKQLKDTKDPKALEAAMKKLKKLQEKLAKLQQELDKLRERAPYENQNATRRPSDNQKSMADMKSTMDKIQELLAEGKVDEAMKLLEELGKNTQELMAALQNDLDAGGSMSAAARQKAQEFSTKLDELADGQRGLKGETGELDRQIDERQARELQEQAKQALEGAKQQARELREQLDGVDDQPLHPSDRDALEQLREDAAALEKEIARGDVGKAAELAQKVAKQAGALKAEVHESEERELDQRRLDGLKAGGDKLGEGEGKAEQLAETLEGLKPKPGEGLEPGEQGEAQRLSERQGELGKKLSELEGALKELDKDMPGLQQEMGEPLEQAGKAMGEAKGELDGQRPGEANGKQQEALEHLEKAQQSMQQRMQQKGGGGDEQQTGINDPKAKVDIPEEDPYAAPRTFREEVLKAMKERAPDKYRDAIQRFYEELIK
jgi:chromosome segregation ATPase